ncbi:MAG: methyltransferase domain-containing protein [Candidatus Eisenbacteria bacterium]|nr:methyltransferase domain-containing protein [Candidatus Eisenbacteria bacterium]
MSFYSDFAGHYEAVFPPKEDTYIFLRERTPERSAVLDVGCGTGDYCARFADEGHKSVGIDVDPEMIAAARARYPKPAFHVLDMSDVGALEGRFGCVYCIGNVLSHLPRPGLDEFLEAVAGLVESGGSWIFQTVNWDCVLGRERFRFPDVYVPEEDLVFEREYALISREGTPFLTRLRRGNKLLFEGDVTLYPLTAPEYVAAHGRHPLEYVGHYSDWRGRDFRSDEMSSSVFHFVRAGKPSRRTQVT